MQQWQSENTRLYFLVKDSVIISGDWEALDRETIKERFTSGRLRGCPSAVFSMGTATIAVGVPPLPGSGGAAPSIAL